MFASPSNNIKISSPSSSLVRPFTAIMITIVMTVLLATTTTFPLLPFWSPRAQVLLQLVQAASAEPTITTDGAAIANFGSGGTGGGPFNAKLDASGSTVLIADTTYGPLIASATPYSFLRRSASAGSRMCTFDGNEVSSPSTSNLYCRRNSNVNHFYAFKFSDLSIIQDSGNNPLYLDSGTTFDVFGMMHVVRGTTFMFATSNQNDGKIWRIDISSFTYTGTVASTKTAQDSTATTDLTRYGACDTTTHCYTLSDQKNLAKFTQGSSGVDPSYVSTLDLSVAGQLDSSAFEQYSANVVIDTINNNLIVATTKFTIIIAKIDLGTFTFTSRLSGWSDYSRIILCENCWTAGNKYLMVITVISSSKDARFIKISDMTEVTTAGTFVATPDTTFTGYISQTSNVGAVFSASPSQAHKLTTTGVVPTATRTQSKTVTVTRSSSRTYTGSYTVTTSRSKSLTPPTPTKSISLTFVSKTAFSLTVSSTATKTKSVSGSLPPTLTTTLTDSGTTTKTVTGSASATLPPTATGTKTRTFTQSPTRTLPPTASVSKNTRSRSSSESFTETATYTPPPTGTVTFSRTRTVSTSVSPSLTNTETLTYTPPPTGTATFSRTVSTSKSGSHSDSYSETVTGGTDTGSRTITDSFTKTGTGTFTYQSLSATATISKTPSESESASITPSRSRSPTLSLSKEITPPPTLTHQLTKSPSPTWSFSRSESESENPTRTQTLSLTSRSSSASLEPTDSKSVTYSYTGTDELTLSTSKSLVPTPSKTVTESQSLSHSGPTDTPSPPPTPSKDITVSDSGFTPTLSESPSFTMSVSSTMTGTVSPSVTLSFTESTSASESESIPPTKTETASESTSSSKSVTASSTESESASPSRSETRTLSESQSISDPTESLSIHPTETPTFPDTVSPSKGTLSLSYSLLPTESLSITFSNSLSFDDTISKSRNTHTKSESGSPDPSMSFTISQSQFTDSESVSHPLTTSAMPPTTSPVPTRTFTFMTRCPSNCFQGLCNNIYPYQCICFKSTAKGFWGGNELGGPCDKCARGFFGPRCDEACPGGACSLCGGHGICDDGQTGSGECICYNATVDGFWEGINCNACQQNYYSKFCNLKCDCSGHGACSSGIYGDGSCSCDFGWYTSAGQPQCGTCDKALVIGCTNSLTCLNDCSSHGICERIDLSNNGRCKCDATYATADCSKRCNGVISPGVACTNKGTCNDGVTGDATCSCLPGFGGLGCEKCDTGYWGLLCDKVCPGGLIAPCNNSGTCLRASGTCQCIGGYGGANCNISCPVGANSLPCNGNGYCNANAECVCFSDNTNGYWDGTVCEQCKSNYRGATCNIRCPELNGTICYGNGVCNAAGKCDCTPPYCGRVCDTILVGTRCNSCPVDGFYGPNCNTSCQCVNGNCSQGINGDGSCECERGWAGVYCNDTCEGGVANPCSGNGKCIQATGGCSCDPGYATANCSVACPVLDCSGHGICSQGTFGDGTCKCEDGFVGPGCETPCDCVHGTCIPGNSTCICEGNWTGTRCDECVPGTSGHFCNLTCFNGVTQGTNCSCVDDWVLPQCDQKCPKDANNATCGGPLQGTCNKDTALCECILPYKGPSCSCRTQVCRDTYNIFADCEPATGNCACVENYDDLENGCEKCKFGYYGPQCRDVCPCSGRGSCDKVTGACSCFQNPTEGYWSGVNCDQCLAGFMGASCQQKAVTLTVITSLSFTAAVPLLNAYSYMDMDRKLYYVGAGNLNLIYNVTPTVPTVLYRPDNYFGCDPLNFGGEAGNMVGVHNNTRHPNSLVYFVGTNSSCNIAPVRVYTTPAEPITMLLANTTNRTWQIKSLQPPGTSDFTFYFGQRNAACHIGSAGGGLDINCATFPPEKFVSIAAVDFNLLRFSKQSPGNVSRIVSIGTDRNSRCSIQFIDVNPDLTLPIRIVHDIHNELGYVGLKCRNGDSFYETTDGRLFWGATADRGSYIGGFDVNGSRVYDGALVTSIPAQCRGIIYDLESGIGLAAFDRTAIKFRIGFNATSGNPLIEPYGQQTLAVPDIVRMDLFSSEQLVYAPRRQVRGVEVLRFLMIEVLAVTPDLADRRGGAVITVTGRGYRNVTDAFCRFASDQVPATYISKTQVSCVAPLSISTETCLVQPVEVSMNGRMFTQNNVLLDRPKDVIITSLSPYRVRHGQKNIIVSLFGRGFIDNVAAKCRHHFDPRKDVDWNIIYDAKYVSPTQYNCIVPEAAIMTFPGSYMTLSLDGQIFSASNAPHEVVGPGDNIICTPDRINQGSTAIVEFAPWPTVFIRDRNNNLLFDFDDKPVRTADIDLAEPDPTFIWINAQTRATKINVTLNTNKTYFNDGYQIINGTAKIDQYAAFVPPVGVRMTRITVDKNWTCMFQTGIIPGALNRLQVRTNPVGPDEIVEPGSVLPQTTEILTVDTGGNPIDGSGITLNATFVSYLSDGTINFTFAPTTQISVRDTGVAGLAPFPTVDIDENKIVFGTEYAIYFVVSNDPSIYTFTNKFKASCPKNLFQVDGETDCRSCPPDEAVCDGTPIIRNQAGFWRISNRTTQFVKCRIAGACPEGLPAAFGAARCTYGYRGALCDDCIEDYGKDSTGLCTKCPSRGTSAGLLSLVLIITFIFLFFMIILSIQNNAIPTSSLGRATVLIALFTTNQQTMSLLSFLGVDWPGGMRVVLNIAAFLFEFRFYALHAVNCLFRDFNMDDSYAFLLFIGITIMVIPMIFVVKLVLKFKPTFLLSRECAKHREEFNAIARKSYTGFWYEGYVKEHLKVPIIMSCLQVFVFYLIQIDMYYLLSMLQCINVGTDDLGQDVMLMNTDVRVDCNSDSYKKLFAFAITCAVLLGGLATFFFFTYMGYYRYRRYEDDFQAVWSFMFLGLKEDLWFWNCIIIFRKILLVLIVSFMKYPISLYLYVWIMMIWSWVEYEKKPYIDQDFNQLSTVFNLVMVFSGNIGMTMQVIDADMTRMILDFLNVLVIVISVILFVWKCSRMFIMRYMELRAEARKEFVDDVDEKEVEEEMQKRHDEELAADRRREDEERESLEKIQKEMRAAAAAASGKYDNQPSEFDDFDAGVGDDTSSRAADPFSSLMDQFYDADKKGDDKRSTVSKSDDRASFVPGRTGEDNIEMTRKSDGRNSETASAYSAASRGSKYSRRGGKRDDNVAQTSYVPTSKAAREDIDDTISGFLSGFDDIDTSLDASKTTNSTDLSALIKAPADSSATKKPFNHYEAAANSRSGAFGDDDQDAGRIDDSPQFNRPTFIEKKIEEKSIKNAAPALPVALPKNHSPSPGRFDDLTSDSIPRNHQPLKPISFSPSSASSNARNRSSPQPSLVAGSAATSSPFGNNNNNKPALPVPLANNNKSSSSPPPPPVPIGKNLSPKPTFGNNSSSPGGSTKPPLPVSRDLAKSLSKVKSNNNRKSAGSGNSSNPFLKNRNDSDEDIL